MTKVAVRLITTLALTACNDGTINTANTAYDTRAGGTNSDTATAVTALSDGSAIITGYFSGTATFGTTTLTSAGESDIFVAKIDALGAW